jgi:hypothetical protein
MIRCIKVRRYEKNTLRAFVDLELLPGGLVLRDCSWHRHQDGKEWVNFPAKPYETQSGKTAWQPIIEFSESAKEARKQQFQQEALAAIHAAVAEQERERS